MESQLAGAPRLHRAELRCPECFGNLCEELTEVGNPHPDVGLTRCEIVLMCENCDYFSNPAHNE